MQNSIELNVVQLKAKQFLNEFENCPFTEKIALIIKFIESNVSIIKYAQSNYSADVYADISDTILMVPAKLFEDLINECLNDNNKRNLLFVEKTGNQESKLGTMWDEYTYLLINYSKWPLTSEAKFIWSKNVLEFGMLKNNESKAKEGNCYIATMAYGDYGHPQVIILRQYRDNVLNRSFLGKCFIKIYYYYSQKLVKKLKNKKIVNTIIRKSLNQFIKLID